MCLAVPGELTSRYDDRGTPMGLVSFGPVVKEACLSLVPDVGVGDWIIVHAGVAITVLDEESAAASLRMMAEMLEDGP